MMIWQTQSGLMAKIIRHPLFGHMCGYVGVLSEHPLYKRRYQDIYDATENIDVHRGITFSEMGDDKYLPAGYWWFGFDCGHANDSQDYWTEDVTKAECEKFAKQLSDIKRFDNIVYDDPFDSDDK